jgi:small Trp-rich protein
MLKLIGLMLIIFKLLGVTAVATWSWWLVLLPFYITYLIGIFVVAGTFVVAGSCFVIAFIIALFNSFNK